MSYNVGWACPRCGAPNAPTNVTCAACFGTPNTESIPEWSPPKDDGRISLMEIGQKCPACNRVISGITGFACARIDCPSTRLLD